MNNRDETVCALISLCSHGRDTDPKSIDLFIAELATANPVLSTRIATPALIQGDWFGEKIILVQLSSRSAALAWFDSEVFKASFAKVEREFQVQFLLM